MLIWQAANSHVPSSRMHSVSNVELPALKNEKAFECGSVGSGVQKPWGIHDKLQVWSALSASALRLRLAQAWFKFLIRWCFIFKVNSSYSSSDTRQVWQKKKKKKIREKNWHICFRLIYSKDNEQVFKCDRYMKWCVHLMGTKVAAVITPLSIAGYCARCMSVYFDEK